MILYEKAKPDNEILNFLKILNDSLSSKSIIAGGYPLSKVFSSYKEITHNGDVDFFIPKKGNEYILRDITGFFEEGLLEKLAKHGFTLSNLSCNSPNLIEDYNNKENDGENVPDILYRKNFILNYKNASWILDFIFLNKPIDKIVEEFNLNCNQVWISDKGQIFSKNDITSEKFSIDFTPYIWEWINSTDFTKMDNIYKLKKHVENVGKKSKIFTLKINERLCGWFQEKMKNSNCGLLINNEWKWMYNRLTNVKLEFDIHDYLNTVGLSLSSKTDSDTHSYNPSIAFTTAADNIEPGWQEDYLNKLNKLTTTSYTSYTDGTSS